MDDKQLSRIGKYEILDKIGEGGFGVVYKGRDPFIKRLVAVKTCSSENEQIQQRFFREAEIAGNLHHANVVTIHDFGVEGSTPYLVQEFLTGEDLDVIIKEAFDSLNLATKVRYLRGIAEGLRYAHSQGVIHRDIKPANIRVLENGRVKVMDFGIAKLKDQESQLTQTGMALGTVAYMSPEQLRGEKIDHRVDIFSYGVLAYELLSGRRPFRAETISTLFYQLLHEPPPPLDLPHLPPELLAVVDRCLAKSVAERYQGFEDVIVALDQVAAEITGAQEERADDPFRPDEQSEAESSAHRLAAKAQRSIDAGDLTAAAMTINMARREVDHATFDRVFANVLEAFQELEKNQAASATSGPRLGEVEQLLSDVELKLLADDYQGAEASLGRLEALAPNDSRVRSLRQRFSAALASRPTSPGAGRATQHAAPPAPLSATGSQPLAAEDGATQGDSRGLGRLPLAIAAGTVGVAIAGVLVWILLSGGGTDGDDVEPTTDPATSTVQPSTDATASSSGTTGTTTLPTGENGTRPPAGDPGASTGTNGTSTGSTESTGTTGTSGTSQTGSTQTGSTQTSSTQTGSTQTSGTNQTVTPPSGTNPSTRGTQSGTSGRDATTTPPGTRTGDQRTQTGTTRGTERTGSTDPRPTNSGGTRTTDTGPSTRDTRDTTATNPGTTTTETQPPSGGRDERPPAEDPPPTTTPSVNISDLREQDAIRRTLTAYQAAWKSLDHEAINLIHPNAGLTRRDVRLYRIADVSFSDCTFRIAGDTATANCRVTRTLEPRDGAPQVERFSGFKLLKQGSGWVIDGLLPGG